jgi:hypothetical protein
MYCVDGGFAYIEGKLLCTTAWMQKLEREAGCQSQGAQQRIPVFVGKCTAYKMLPLNSLYGQSLRNLHEYNL